MNWELVIFDCDGVLVDSEPISRRVAVELLSEIGVSISVGQAAELFTGLSLSSIFRIIEERFGILVPDSYESEYYKRMDVAFRAELKSEPGIVQALDAISLPSCVASSGPHEKMQTTLGVTGLLSRFEGRIFSSRDVERGKPYPDLFLHAAANMQTSPAKCVVVEDSLPGVQAAVAAGMSVFGYARASSPAALENAGAVIFDDMTELPELLNGKYSA